MTAWHESVDFLVVGSGAAGMTAAVRAHDLGASTVVIEKAPLYGGSTALSGGVVWVPANPLMPSTGIADSPEEGLRYLENVTAGSSSLARLRAFVEGGPRMMDYLAAHSRVRFTPIADYPDYYPERAGGKPGARSSEPVEFDARELGAEFARQRLYPSDQLIMRRLRSTAAEGKVMLGGGWPATRVLARLFLRYAVDRRGKPAGMRNPRLTLGGALTARLRRSLMDRGVPLLLNTRLARLVLDRGRVVGVEADQEGRRRRIETRRGVLLATGGFERKSELRRRYQQAPTGDAWTAGCDSNEGDAIAIGAAAGATLDLMDEAWWCPALLAPGERSVRLVIFEKNLPGSIIVNQRGERFMNEAAPYNDVVKAMYAANRTGASTIPAYLIFDRSFRTKYPCGPVMPATSRPDWTLSQAIKEDFLTRDGTLSGLAAKLGIDAAGLEATVARFNGFARTGEDPDFGRGDSLQDRYYTVSSRGANPNLAPLERAPFYAVKVFPGDLGTKGGFRTDPDARVLNGDGAPIAGLYAAGNCSAAVMGRSYPGAGGTIAPAMTFGFLAAEHAIEGASHDSSLEGRRDR